MHRFLPNYLSLPLTASLLLLAGCATGRGRWPVKLSSRPVVAVNRLQDLSGFDGKWKLDEGMTRLFTADLRASRDLEISPERVQSGAVRDLIEQGKDLLTKDDKPATPRPTKARYIVSGAVTEFSVPGDSSGWFATSRTRGSRASVEIELQVADAGNGTVLSSFKVRGSSPSSKGNAAVKYKDIPFGGKVFSETPLGKAADKALRQGTRKILRAIPPEYWQPRIAEAGPDMAIINGGENAKVRKNDEFIVREESRDITDPVTGRIIETVPGIRAGRIRVTRVNEYSSHAQIVEGNVRRGQVLELIQEQRR